MRGELIARKTTFSVHPWRVFVVSTGALLSEHTTFPLKRDAVAWIETVEHLPFSRPVQEWSPELLAELQKKILETPGAKLHIAAIQRSGAP